MKKFAMLIPVVLAFVTLSGSPALAQGLVGTQDKTQGMTLTQVTSELGVLKGRWVRPTGATLLSSRALISSGKIDATYFNPNPVNVSKAEVSREGGALRLFLELRGAGYPGSTYTLTYEPRSDSLTGVYFQAVMQQKFDVVFQRAK